MVQADPTRSDLSFFISIKALKKQKKAWDKISFWFIFYFFFVLYS